MTIPTQISTLKVLQELFQDEVDIVDIETILNENFNDVFVPEMDMDEDLELNEMLHVGFYIDNQCCEIVGAPTNWDSYGEGPYAKHFPTALMGVEVLFIESE